MNVFGKSYHAYSHKFNVFCDFGYSTSVYEWWKEIEGGSRITSSTIRMRIKFLFQLP